MSQTLNEWQRAHTDAPEISPAAQEERVRKALTFARRQDVSEYADWFAKDRALHEAAGLLQEARGRLKAAELGKEDDEVRAIVGVRRAERQFAEAQQVAQIARDTVVRVAEQRRAQLMYEQMRKFNTRARGYQEAYTAELKRINEQADAQQRELDQWRATHILPLVELGAAEAPRVVSTGLYAID